MELIITEDCSLKNQIEPLKDMTVSFFSKIIDEMKLHTLDKVIITDYDFNNYSRSVKEISEEIDKNAVVTENGVAIVIDGINKDNKFVQYIFIRGNILLYFFYYLSPDRKNNNEKIYKIAYSTIWHEIGHCIYSDILYTNYNYIASNKSVYNLSFNSQLNEYIYHECVTLTSEYYAECFMNSVCNEGEKDYTEEMIEIINDNYFKNRADSINKVYRLIYYFILNISYYHIKSKKILFYENISNYEIVKELKKLENELIIFYDKFNEGNFNVNNIIAIFKEIYNIKYSSYDMI